MKSFVLSSLKEEQLPSSNSSNACIFALSFILSSHTAKNKRVRNITEHITDPQKRVGLVSIFPILETFKATDEDIPITTNEKIPNNDVIVVLQIVKNILV